MTESRENRANTVKPPLFQSRAIIKEQVYSGCLFLVYTIDQSFTNMCIKFQFCVPLGP